MSLELPRIGDEANPFDEILAGWLDLLQTGVPEELAAFLDRHPQQVACLRDCQREVEATRPWIDPVNQALRPRGPALDESFDLGPGDMFGDFELIEVLGVGGMGVVFKARQPGLKRIVALKLVRAGADATAHDLNRFQREVELHARLKHPNIITIHSAGEHAGRPFLCMEHLSGGSLDKQLQRYAADPRGAALLVAKVSRAIQHAHDQLVLHRDLKPSNLLLDPVGEPFVCDFGLAKNLETPVDLSRSLSVVGAPSYMSPEQALGQEATITSDVYGLGAVLYALLTGDAPFRGVSTSETLELVRTAEPVFPNRTRNKLPPVLVAICLKCLEKDPTCRFATASELADDLERLLKGEPTRTRPPTLLQRAAKRVRRHVGTLATVALLLSMAGGFMAFAMLLLLRSPLPTAKEYAFDMNIAHMDWQRGKVTEVKEILEKYLPTKDGPDLRGFEWHWLNSTCNYVPETIDQHIAEVTAVAISPDGQWLATGDDRGVVKLRKMSDSRTLVREQPGKFLQGKFKLNGKEIEEGLQIGKSGIQCQIAALQFSPNSKMLASAGGEKLIRVRDVNGWKESEVLVGFDRTISSIAYSPDGKKLVAGHRYGPNASMWDLKSIGWIDGVNFPSRQWGKNDDSTRAVNFSPDGKSLLMANYDTLTLWDVKTGKLASSKGNALGHLDGMIPAAFVPNRNLIVAGGYSSSIRFWESDTLAEWTTQEARDAIVCISIEKEGRVLATSGSEGNISLIDIARNWRGVSLRRTWRDGNQKAYIALNPDGRILVTGSASGHVKRWDTEELAGLSIRPIPCMARSISHDGSKAVGLTGGDALFLLDCATGDICQKSDLVSQKGRLGLSFSRDKVRLTCIEQNAAGERHVEIWSVDGLALVHRFKLPGRTQAKSCLSPDGRSVAICGNNGAIEIYSSSGEKIHVFAEAVKDDICLEHHAIFSTDGTKLFTVMDYIPRSHYASREIRVWDVRQGKEVAKLNLPEHAGGGHALEISADGKYLAAGVGTSSIQIFDLETMREVAHRTRHSRKVERIAFSPDGRNLATLSQDGVVKLWSTATMDEMFTLSRCTDWPFDIRFAEGGRKLHVLIAAPNGKGEMLVWDSGPR